MEFEKLRDIIVEVLNVDETEVTMESTFIDDLGADSLDVFQIIMEKSTDRKRQWYEPLACNAVDKRRCGNGNKEKAQEITDLLTAHSGCLKRQPLFF